MASGARRRASARPAAKRRTAAQRRNAARRRRAARAAGIGVALIPFVIVIALAVHFAGSVSAEAPAEPAQAAAPVPPVTLLAPDEPAGDDTQAAEEPGRADPAWLDTVAERTGIPARALAAYAGAELELAADQPGCGIAWNTLAAIGSIESGHGSHGGATLQRDGWVSPRILGPRLDGDGVAAIRDTDGGEWDGDDRWDRAVGPMQFIPETWGYWGADGNADGIRDPSQLDDAALGAARYLCDSGSMEGTDAWRSAVFRYNQLTQYVDDVARVATEYADRAAS
ncbi:MULTISPECIES: lytic transglycosylase domain-containing protein [unclassified Microbacterium]|uniref:lytic transglycosylase domain-containing protein n=1 Tax=unclassified Microbacterium TaxID=2609290 RepID=UPI00386740DB